ncbi:prepilin-type N-terminal cleavage/methylation domain-containing protein [Variovorax sp. RKNM96]|uniref:GspH/FimT family pseudopilin n=1 Tax=Variovorax sp. RKNM96 TaxID=2681552 RepID=UPI0019814AF3|nr:GspH/FimT family pseudopilin [Variovorax sp. RKNM96]QSI34085.1 prepilin-type N-terminal cleavage/methylation domain-containing protein [Variovorax sp. RKNM96]
MNKSASPPQRQKGFTLIEMMVVVSLVAILAALALPSFTTMIANQRVTSAAQELLTLLQFARAEGVYKRTQTTVTATGLTWQAKAGAQVLREATLSDAVSVVPGSAGGVTFDVSGQASAAAGVTSYAVTFSATNATRVQCLSVTRAGLVRLLPSVPAGQACP